MSFAALKRRLRVGTSVTLIAHPRPYDALDVPREIVRVQSNAVAFESHLRGKPPVWLYWPDKAADVAIDGDQFTVRGMVFRIEAPA
jgi:hypothetical protein